MSSNNIIRPSLIKLQYDGKSRAKWVQERNVHMQKLGIKKRKKLHRRRSGSGGPAFAGPMFYANVPPPLRAHIVHGHTVCKHGTCSVFPRLCLTKVYETATPLNYI